MSGVVTCPGINKFVRPKPEYIKCHRCRVEVEIWSDEREAKCLECGAKVSREVASCLDYCEYASKCKAIIEQKRKVEIQST